MLRKEETSAVDAIVECVADCSNPFIFENRLRARLLAVREARYKLALDFKSPRTKSCLTLRQTRAKSIRFPPALKKRFAAECWNERGNISWIRRCPATALPYSRRGSAIFD